MHPSPYKRVIIILADGARLDVLSDLARAGDMPNISRHLIEKGSFIDGVTCFPSTTGPAFLPFLTGCLPGTCNIPGIRWFDKIKYDQGRYFDGYRSYVGFESFLMTSDASSHIKTIFELIPDSFSIFNPIARGAKGRRNLTRISRIWHWYYAHLTDHWAFTDRSALKKLIRVQEKSPKFVFAVFPGIDVITHLTHPHHPKVIDRYGDLDHSIGELVRVLHKRGELEETAIFIVSDHGLSATHTHFCVNTFLENHGLPPFFYPLIYKKKGKLSASMVSGNGMTHVYFKNFDGWARHTTRRELQEISPRLIEDILNEEAIAIVALRNEEGGVDVITRLGEAKIVMDGSTILYRVTGKDPFGYSKIAERLTPDECLKTTFNTNYPDAPFQLAHLITASRSGDMILSATPGFDLRLKYEDPEHKSSHGSLHAQHMKVPIISNVRFQKTLARTVDVFPSVLGLLGAKPPEYLDGTPL